MRIRAIHISIIAGLVLVGVPFAGCGGGNCQRICEAAEGCRNSSHGSSCAEICAASAAAHEASGCGAKYDAWTDCVLAKQTDACDIDPASCFDLRDAYEECATE